MINRRQFIKYAALGYGSLLVMPGCVRGTLKGPYRVFSAGEADCLSCICEQFIPSDEYAGAKEAGVVNFIDKLLYQRFPELAEPYRKGIRALEGYCEDTYKKGFARLSWEEQQALLVQMEQGGLSGSYWDDIPQKEFFNMALRNTMQGYYGPPRHGGNKEYVSYRMMRLDFPLLIGQNRYGK
ncbi:MAG: gluconate 2-dehydrogenase subunit 3 family protein [Prevotella sp.]|jgi:gluconate 2-dehydrogenase gamma chain|nr:gluconate 2-dehydrogenase subunit 3 family protein [Prevotella sp.]